MAWFVRINAQIYGPYEGQRMASFVREGRITQMSQISAGDARGFGEAQTFPEFRAWLSTGEAQVEMKQAVGQSQPQPTPRVHSQLVIPETVRETTPQPKAEPGGDMFFIMCELRSGDTNAFERKLAEFGAFQRLGDTVWLVCGKASVEKMRNQLSQLLERQDRLFILNATSDETAWFNIGADLDYRIRKMWDAKNGKG